MKVFVAGASGAIGQPLIAELIRKGHTVTGMSRSEARSQNLAALGATIAVVNAFDEAAVAQALRRAQAEAVIDQLTALPKDPGRRKNLELNPLGFCKVVSSDRELFEVPKISAVAEYHPERTQHVIAGRVRHARYRCLSDMSPGDVARLHVHEGSHPIASPSQIAFVGIAPGFLCFLYLAEKLLNRNRLFARLIIVDERFDRFHQGGLWVFTFQELQRGSRVQKGKGGENRDSRDIVPPTPELLDKFDRFGLGVEEPAFTLAGR